MCRFPLQQVVPWGRIQGTQKAVDRCQRERLQNVLPKCNIPFHPPFWPFWAGYQACGQEKMWLCNLGIWEKIRFSSLFPVLCVFSTLTTKYYIDSYTLHPPSSIWNTKAISGTWSWCNCIPTGAIGPFFCLPTNFPRGFGGLCCAVTQPRQVASSLGEGRECSTQKGG